MMFMYKVINKTKGAISIFMAIVLFSMVAFTGVVIDAARIRSGEAINDSAIDVAANALLAKYNQQLKECFGLFALSEADPAALNEDFMYYMKRCMMVPGLKDDKAMTGDAWREFQKLLKLDDEQKGKGYLNINGFGVPNAKITPLYSLAEPEVLKNQIVDYMKFRAPKSLGSEVIDKINALKGYQKQTEVYEKKLAVDKQIDDISDKINDLAEDIKKINQVENKTLVESHVDNIIKYVNARIAVEMRIKELKKTADKKETTASAAPSTSPSTSPSASPSASPSSGTNKNEESPYKNKSLAELQKISIELKIKIEECFNGYTDNQKKPVDGLNIIITDGVMANNKQNIEDMVKEIKAAKEGLDNKAKSLQGELKNDNSEFAAQVKDELEEYQKKIDDKALDKIYKKIEFNYKMLKEGTTSKITLDTNISFSETKGYFQANSEVENLIDSMDFSKMNYAYDDKESIEKHVKSILINKLHMFDSYYKLYQRINPNEFPGIDETKGKGIDDPREVGKEVLEGDNNPVNQIDNMAGLEEKEFPQDLPSLLQDIASSAELINGFKQDDEAYAREQMTGGLAKDKDGNIKDCPEIKDIDNLLNDPDFEDTDFSENAIGALQELFKFLEQGAEELRNELYIGEYAMGHFKHHLTKDGEDKDLRGVNMSARTTFMANEVEYVLNGEKDEKANLRLTESKILLIRFALNTLYIYTDAPKKAQTLAAATAICNSFFPGFGSVAIKLVQNLMILSWSMAESVYDMKEIMAGNQTVLFKTRNTWFLSVEGVAGSLTQEGAKQLKSGLLKSFNETAKAGVDKAVNYGVDKAEDVSNQTYIRINDMIEQRIDTALNRTMKPVEDAIHSETKKLGDNVAELDAQMDAKAKSEIAQIDNDLMKEAVTQIYALAKQEKLGTAQVDQLLGMGKEQALLQLETLKTGAKRRIVGGITPITDKLMAQTNEVVSKASDSIKNKANTGIDKATDGAEKKLDQFIGTLGNGSNANSGVSLAKGNTKPNVKSSMVAFGYTDYLRMLLLTTPSTKKVLRIGDLVQLDMQTMGNEGFKLTDAKTYVRIKSEVTMKYLFMTSGLIPEGYKKDGDHTIKSITYKGY